MKSYAEFFAGVGLVREGLSSSGWHCAWANDISSDKMMTYCENFGDCDFWLGDIWDVVKSPQLIPNDLFLYTASFPCTDLSVAGGRAGLAGAQSGTLNALFEIIIEKEKTSNKPPVVLLENVKGFLTSHNGSDAANTVKNFSDLGYVVDIIELDASRFTPQSRPRVFIIAVEKSIAKQVMTIKDPNSILDTYWQVFDRQPGIRTTTLRNLVAMNEELSWGIFDIHPPSQSSLIISDIVESDMVENSPLWWNDERKEFLFNQMSERHKDALNELVKKSFFSYGTVYRRVRKGVSMAELRTDGLAGCLRTPKGGSSKQILIRAGKGDWRVRLMTPREYARLQGVRDSFKLPSNANKGYYAMGDAVCVPVIEFIAKNILDNVYSAWISANNNLQRQNSCTHISTVNA